METEFKKLTEDEYRNFEAWIRENGKELYENKIAYEVRWGKDDDTYTVRLCDESSYTLNDRMCNMTSSNQRTLSPLSPNVNDLVWLQSMTSRVVSSKLSQFLTNY